MNFLVKNRCGFFISKDAKTGEVKHSLFNATEDTSLEKLAEMQSSRYWVERAFQDEKRIAEWMNIS